MLFELSGISAMLMLDFNFFNLSRSIESLRTSFLRFACSSFYCRELAESNFEDH
jgi:hypothetical protein